MKKNILCTVLSGLAVFAFVGEAVAQPQINRSAYFLGGATYRHELNPAFMGRSSRNCRCRRLSVCKVQW